MAAAVGDYRPKGAAASKIHDKALSVDLEKNPDLLVQIAKQKAKRIVVGFSLEDKDQLSRAKTKLKSKQLDFVVFNTPAAIGETQSEASIIRGQGRPVDFGMQTKWQLANCILDECMEQMSGRKRK
jgi:phosphopantothenoylcysteine decarboxylase/phosphopantothenate--cysteine ligase